MSIYDLVTSRILARMEQGVVPWHKPWTTGLPKSLASGREYRGINLLLLSASEYSSGYWLTYREAQRLGGHVRRGERATTVVYWKWRTPEEREKLRAERGIADPAPCVPFSSAVFNLDQVEGVPPPEDAPITVEANRLAPAEQLIGAIPQPPEIRHCITQDPAYLPGEDRIVLPHLSQFSSADEYYATLFHELMHATGHPQRLNRFSSSEVLSRRDYSFEELVAELGAAFLGAIVRLENQHVEELQTGYLAGWMKAFREDSQVLLRAASAAQRGVDYLRGVHHGAGAAEIAA
ncbi:MAG: DUF1738 domain-containing protein [Verrucomicrobiales bacterium]|nr:DUF1738 domain-containing protein [Verrucomicrobiales bacterium]